MRNIQFAVRCYAEQEKDGSWFAMCVDLNLYARADSLRAVKRELGEIIDDYVREALTVDREYVEDLLRRPAPLPFWLKYYWIKLRCRLSGRNHDGHHRHFKNRLPLQPAW